MHLFKRTSLCSRNEVISSVLFQINQFTGTQRKREVRGRAVGHKGSNFLPTQHRHYTHCQPQPVIFTSEPALKLNPTGFVSHHYWVRRTLNNNLSKACEIYIKHSGADFHFLQADRLVYRDAASSRATPSPLRAAHTLATIGLDLKKRMWTVLRQDYTDVLESICAVLTVRCLPLRRRATLFQAEPFESSSMGSL